MPQRLATVEHTSHVHNHLLFVHIIFTMLAGLFFLPERDMATKRTESTTAGTAPRRAPHPARVDATARRAGTRTQPGPVGCGPGDLRTLARRLALASRRTQGLPDYVTDPAALARITDLVVSAEAAERARHRSGVPP